MFTSCVHLFGHFFFLFFSSYRFFSTKENCNGKKHGQVKKTKKKLMGANLQRHGKSVSGQW